MLGHCIKAKLDAHIWIQHEQLSSPNAWISAWCRDDAQEICLNRNIHYREREKSEMLNSVQGVFIMC